MFGVSQKALVLCREVEYYQVEEKSSRKSTDKAGGAQVDSVTYSYVEDWTSSPINSSEFKDPAFRRSNFTLTSAEDNTQHASNVSFGAYKLNDKQLSTFTADRELALNISADKIKSLSASALLKFRNARPDAATSVGDATMAHVDGNQIYIGLSPASPQVGDVKIKFTYAPAQATITLLATVNGNTFKSYEDKNGKSLFITQLGTHSADEILSAQQEGNQSTKWFLRLSGFLLIFGGLMKMFGIIESILKAVPPIATILGFGAKVICGVLAAVISMIIVSIAWFYYRPWLSISLILISLFVVWLFSYRGKEKLKDIAKRVQEQAQTGGISLSNITKPTSTSTQSSEIAEQ